MSNLNSKPPVKDKPTQPVSLPGNWADMSGGSKFEFLATAWASTEGKIFASSQIEATYRRRAQRWLDVVTLKKPDRVPVCFLNGEFGLYYGGCKPVDHFYQPKKASQALYKFHKDFDCDYTAIGMPASGQALDILGYKLSRWPGGRVNALSENMQCQYIEKEYMPAKDYDELIADPQGYAMYSYLPCICEGLKGLTMGINPYWLGEMGGVVSLLMSLAKGPLRQALDTLLKASDQAFKDMMSFFPVSHQIQFELGAPNTFGGSSKAPFDIVGDTMRGTHGIMLDMYRRPEKVSAACDALIPASIKMAVQSAMNSRVPFVTLWLHKGADGFMSNKQFERFYWPSLEAALQGMINEGLVPLLFVQGGYNQRLDIISASNLPPGKTIWLFDKTDMKAAKERLGGIACIGGNVPSSLFSTGTPEMMEDYCKKLIDTMGLDGGFFLSPGAAIDQAKSENVRAFFDSAKRLGKYSEFCI